MNTIIVWSATLNLNFKVFKIRLQVHVTTGEVTFKSVVVSQTDDQTMHVFNKNI